jgi:hypothetical protein
MVMVAVQRGRKSFPEAVAAQYRPPTQINSLLLRELLERTARRGLKDEQLDLLRTSAREVTVPPPARPSCQALR